VADEKTKKRIAALLRTADPKSGASDNERQIAALEAAKMIAEHGLVVDEAPPPPQRVRPSPPPVYQPPARPSIYGDYHHYGAPAHHYRYGGNDFRGTFTSKNERCAQCGRTIYEGEEAFYDPEHGYIHHDITCRQ
jgi:hypothetical protein